MPEISYPQHADIPVSHLPFSPVVRLDNMLFVSGQASVDDTGKFIPGTFKEEFDRSMDNLNRILKGAGSDPSKIVQVRCYVNDPDDIVEFNRLYAEHMKAPYPARTTITRCFGQLKFEIDCIAAV